jgi:hypothetical protein
MASKKQRKFIEMASCQEIQFVLFGFRLNLALHPERSSLSHSCRYASADDRPDCFASFPLIPESFMQYAGMS